MTAFLMLKDYKKYYTGIETRRNDEFGVKKNRGGSRGIRMESSNKKGRLPVPNSSHRETQVRAMNRILTWIHP